MTRQALSSYHERLREWLEPDWQERAPGPAACSGRRSRLLQKLAARREPATETWTCSAAAAPGNRCSWSRGRPAPLHARSERACSPFWSRGRPGSAASALQETSAAWENQTRIRRDG